MAIAVVSIGSVGDTTARSAQSCALARAPGANTLVLVGVCVSDVVGTPAEPSGVIGAGLTFSLVTSSISYDITTAGSQNHNLSLWRAMGASPDGSMVTATFANNNTGCAILVTEVSGVSKAGTNGSSAVSGSAITMADALSAVTAFFPSVSSTANAWFSILGADIGSAAPRPNWTSLDSSVYATPTTNFYSAYTLVPSGTSVAWAGLANTNPAVIAVELVGDNPAIPTTTNAAQWIQGFGVSGPRVFQPRGRGNVWVEAGHAVNTDPATDTREG